MRVKRLAAVLGVEELDVGGVDPVLVLGVGVDVAVVPGALAQLAVVAGLGPGLAAVARAEEAPLLGLDDGVEVLRVGGGDGDAVDADRPLGEPGVAGQLAPVVAAVGRLPDPRAGAAALQAVGGAPEAPHRGVEDARVAGVHGEVDRARPVVDEEHALPVAAAVAASGRRRASRWGRRRGPARRRRPGRGSWDGCGCATICRPSARPDELPGLAGVGRLPDAVAVRDVAAHRHLAAAGVDDVGVPVGDRDGADRAAEEAVRDVLPGAAAVGRLPHAAAGAAEVVGVAVAAARR